jgi:hypothetical protein
MAWEIVSSPIGGTRISFVKLSFNFEPHQMGTWSGDDYAEVVLHHDSFLVEEGRPNFSVSISHLLMEYHRERAGLKRPFSNGSQFCDWTASNCDSCTKYATGCEVATGLAEAALGWGLVRGDIAARMGLVTNDGRANWPCPEHAEATP